MTPGDALHQALLVEVEATPAELVAAGGGIGAIARRVAGLDPAPRRLPASGTAAYKSYRTARRNLERYGKGRQPGADVRRVLRQVAAQLSADATKARAQGFRQVAHASMTATTSDATPNLRRTVTSRTRTLPAAGHPVRMPASEQVGASNDRWVDAYLAGQVDQAGELFTEAFLTAYGAPGIDVTDVDQINLTPEG